MSDIQRLNGSFEMPQSINNKSIITGRGPVAYIYGLSIRINFFYKRDWQNLA